MKPAHARITGPGPATMTVEEWRTEGSRRFGPDQLKWRFKCPSCEHEACAEDWKAAGAPETAVAYSCVGRWIPTSTGEIWQKGKGPCNYAGGGLFRLNPITVIDEKAREHHVFEFAPAVLLQDGASPVPRPHYPASGETS